MRNAFIDELLSLASERDNIALVVGDLGYSVVEPFADRFLDRFINAGVAEQNMTGLAAGMASEGYHVFTYSIAYFPTFRCAEQLRNDIDYHQLPVTVAAVGGGAAYGALGYSHPAVQDYALMRCMPNMLIAAPGDPMEVRACMRYLVNNPLPSYFRLGKAGEPCFHKDVPSVEPGEWRNNQQYRGAGVFSLPLWGALWKKLKIKQLKKHNLALTLEDHLVDGGFGT